MAEVLRPNPLVRTVTDAADVYGLSSGFSDLSVGSTTTTTTTATTTPGQGAQKGAENYVIRLPRRAYSYTEQFAGGEVEARCADGVRFRDGRTLVGGRAPAA